MPLVDRSNSNVIGGVKKVEAKIMKGATLRRPVLGDLANAGLPKKTVGKQVSKSVSSVSSIIDKKCTNVLQPRIKGKENINALQKSKSLEKPAKKVDPIPQKTEIETIKEVEVQPTTKVDEIVSMTQLLNVEDIDAEDKDNLLLVTEYVNEIYKYLRSLEVKYPIKESFLSDSIQVTSKMRALLVDWLVSVHLKFMMYQETLFLTIAILDRYLMMDRTVTKNNLQLVGVTAMYIASKYEEMHIPEIQDFVYITENAFTKNQILSCEIKMLKALEFNLSFPLPLHFLRRNSKAGMVEAKHHTMAKYLMEICLLEYKMAHIKPSKIAAAALLFSIRILDNEDAEWSDTLTYYSNYSEKEINQVVYNIAALVVKSTSIKHQAIQNKYSSSRLFKISRIPQLQSQLVSELAAKQNLS